MCLFNLKRGVAVDLCLSPCPAHARRLHGGHRPFHMHLLLPLEAMGAACHGGHLARWLSPGPDGAGGLEDLLAARLAEAHCDVPAQLPAGRGACSRQLAAPVEAAAQGKWADATCRMHYTLATTTVPFPTIAYTVTFPCSAQLTTTSTAALARCAFEHHDCQGSNTSLLRSHLIGDRLNPLVGSDTAIADR